MMKINKSLYCWKYNLRKFSGNYLPPTSIKEYKIITQTDVDKFANLTGDLNPIHNRNQPIEKRFVHGSFLNAIVSGIIGTKLPGPGTIVLSQTINFPNKCIVDKEIEIYIEIVNNRKIIDVIYECKQMGIIVFNGTAKLINNNNWKNK